MISSNPYERVKIKRGRNKEREPLTEDELKALRMANLTGKFDRVRDLFIFSAYTGLSYADAQLFDYKTMTEKQGDMYYIDGERIKNRFTSFRRIDEHNPAYTKVIPLLSKDQYRNKVIINNVRAVLEAKRSHIILTSLTEHVNILADMLRPYCKNVVTLIGSASTKEKRQNMERLNSIPAEEPSVIVATGKYVGEGFDYPRLDTLFMALPVSWKGIVAQYVGRLHREYNGKNEVEIYDYIDIHIPVCESMYRKRMKGYAAIGYSIKTEDALFRETINTSQVILDGKTFVRPFISSISKARKSILLSCPKIKMEKYSLIAERLRDIALNGITIIIFTETENEDIRKLQSYGFHVIIKPKNNFNCAIIENTQIWYGSVNLLGYHSEEDNIITFNDAKVATEIINTLSP